MIWNALQLALRAILRNVTRSFLTVLGILIGVSAVITMVTLGNGATRAVQDQIASLGSNLLILRPGQRLGPGGGVGAPNFRLADAQAIEAQVSGVDAVAPSVARNITVVRMAHNWSTSVTGSSNAFFATGSWTLAEGRYFTDTEERAGRAVCVIGATVRRELFGAQSPIGGDIRVRQFACEVIGLLAAKGQSTFGMDQDDLIVMPLRTVQRRLTGTQEVSSIRISVQNDVAVDRTMAAVQELMRERRKIGPSEEDNFSVMDTRQIAETLTGTTRVMTMLLGAVAAVSLIVGGIGIMNIMLVSVTERTREIGIRLAIGALERDVLLQFLIEAVTLASLGGIIGVVLAAFASWQLARMMQVPFLFDPGINVLSFLFSAAIGVVFGYFPARRAARLDPIEALRHE
jgi:putative ABC transport system permease protein